MVYLHGAVQVSRVRMFDKQSGELEHLKHNQFRLREKNENPKWRSIFFDYFFVVQIRAKIHAFRFVVVVVVAAAAAAVVVGRRRVADTTRAFENVVETIQNIDPVIEFALAKKKNVEFFFLSLLRDLHLSVVPRDDGSQLVD